MRGYFAILAIAIIVSCGRACRRSNSPIINQVNKVIKPQSRNRIRKPKHDLRTKEHLKKNYHELKRTRYKTRVIQHSKSEDEDEDRNRTRMERKHGKIDISDIEFPVTYHATGLLTLPYDGIMEPFEIWYAKDFDMSRIDYYHGLDKTFQRGDLKDYGVYIKEIPIHKTKFGNNNKNSKSCWFETGTEYDIVRPQSVVPMDLSHFKIIGEEYKSGLLTIKLRRHVKTGNLKNTFTLWVSKEKPHTPIRYETEGFDILLRGYYDHYYLDYITFNDWYFDLMVMEVPKDSPCHDEVIRAKSRYFVNPMSEFVHKPHEVHEHHKHIEKTFKHFKRKHGKKYKDAKEHSKRRNIYRHNARYIRSKNRARLNYTLALNHLADLTPEEFRVMDDLLYQGDEGVSEFMKEQFPNRDEVPLVNYTEPTQPLPENLDWREYGVVSPIRGQSMCGACWAFSTAAMLEGAYKIATGNDIEFSAQMLVDCTFGFKNYGCRGGWPWKAMQWIILNGIATYQSYGRYLAQEGLCHCGPNDNCTIHYPSSFGDVMRANRTAMKVNLATYGPVSVGINSSPKSFKFYRDGVYDDFDCDETTQHSVAIVGYGKQPFDLNYWIIKNSWGPYWGRKGYMKISNDEDTCGILSSNGVVGNFRNTSRGFPFERMKKVVTPKQVDNEGRTRKDAFKPIFNSIPFN